MLTEAGHQVSIVCADPIFKAISGRKFLIDRNKMSNCIDYELSFSDLIKHNIAEFERLLMSQFGSAA